MVNAKKKSRWTLEDRTKIACYIANYCVKHKINLWDFAQQENLTSTTIRTLLDARAGDSRFNTFEKVEKIIQVPVRVMVEMEPDSIPWIEWDNTQKPHRFSSKYKKVQNPFEIYCRVMKRDIPEEVIRLVGKAGVDHLAPSLPDESPVEHWMGHKIPGKETISLPASQTEITIKFGDVEITIRNTSGTVSIK